MREGGGKCLRAPFAFLFCLSLSHALSLSLSLSVHSLSAYPSTKFLVFSYLS